MTHLFAFEKLEVWQKSRQLVRQVYVLLKTFPAEEKYSLVNQLQRAVVSIPSNIAEGSSRQSPKEQSRFTEIAYGSLMETYCQLNIAKDLGYINEESLSELRSLIFEVSRMLSVLRNSQLSRV